MARGNQLTRQWMLVRLLSSRAGRTLAQLRAELGVGKRTVQRDIAVLEAAGFPVTSEGRNGTVRWHFMEGFRVEAPVSLTLTEQMALYFSKGLLKPLQGTPIHASLDSALQKIGAALPPQSFQFLRGLEQGVAVRTAGFKDYSRSRDVLDVLMRSVRHKFTTRINHRTAQFEEGIEREVDPYRLWYVNNGIYVVGRDHRSGEIRAFAVERIASARPTNRRFEIPDDFDFDKLTETAFNLIWGEPQEVKIRFSHDQAPYVQERTWHPSQKIDKRPDGSIDLTMCVGNVWEIKRWLIGWGADARVLQPESLRKEITDECVRLLRGSRGKSVRKRRS
ncbi:MAG: WYL domain-containing protein [Candidatus Sulfotelmatobacter sp.]